MSDPVRLVRDGRRATITLGRPPLNILDLEMIAALDARLLELAGDDEIQLVVLRGAGEKAFSAGVSVGDHVGEKVPAMLAGFHGAIRRLRKLPATTLAVVDGACLGGGMELALVCDLVLATDRARFGQPEIRLGCYPPVAAALYPSRLGHGRTMELLLTGRPLDAEEAERLGLVTWRVAHDQLDARLDGLADELTRPSAAVARLTKRAVLAGGDYPFEAALEIAERLYLEELAPTDDMCEGIAAFLEKRSPVWRHR
ncbi:MAG: enoyl-CoA hydratase/isomerase family protein [Holophagales bacterium]|nr:MAG: enoyl-CoA hydratase/isomerase family protein [Holophagales bacterium]